jgi:hypothetical protein
MLGEEAYDSRRRTDRYALLELPSPAVVQGVVGAAVG